MVIYHGECSDGFCAAWVINHVFPHAEYIPALHNQKPPDTTNREVYLLDFCYKRPAMEVIRQKSKSILVLDHHKSAEVDLKGMPNCIFDMNRSGCGITWDYFKSKLPHNDPWIVQYIQDRDLCRWFLPNSKAINAAIDLYPMKFDVWENLWSQSKKELMDRLIEEGNLILKFQERLIERVVKSAREVNLAGYKVLAANCSTLAGEVATFLSKNRPFGIAWFQRSDGQFVYSLRSDSMDVSKVATMFNGGGHFKMAGFETHVQIL